MNTVLHLWAWPLDVPVCPLRNPSEDALTDEKDQVIKAEQL